MKVVCVNVPPTNIITSLKEGDIFETILLYDSLNGKTHYIVDSYENVIPCDAFDTKFYFLTIDEFREQKLQKLGI